MKLISPPYQVIAALILLVVAFLFFFRLDQRPFWQDEAETACLAKNVLKFGIPKAFDGVNLISQEEGRKFNADYLWRWSPWLQIYVAAAAFKAGGLTTAAGRLPFALAGLASVWLVYFFINRRFQDPAWALWSAALLALSVPFLLFSRQCRYYGLGALLISLNLYAFRSDWQSRFTPAALLVGSLPLLFYTNYLLFFSYGGALLLAVLLVYHRELPPSRTLKVSLCTILAVLPSLALFRLEQQAGMLNFTLIFVNLEHYFADLFQFETVAK
jgi:4-amino-4-deoxy-L-arabinose transferase-like glycosyltransferase